MAGSAEDWQEFINDVMFYDCGLCQVAMDGSSCGDFDDRLRVLLDALKQAYEECDSYIRGEAEALGLKYYG